MTSISPSQGIVAGGSWCVDHLKVLDRFPEETTLAVVLEEFRSNGGGPYNLLKDLSRMGAAFPLVGVGLFGLDENGRYIRDDCAAAGIATDNFAVTDTAPTSFTDVLSVQSTGRRTFLHGKGTNELLTEHHFDFGKLRGRLFHLAYLNILKSMEVVGEDGKTGTARVLKRAREAGFTTCADLVSLEREDFVEVVRPALPFVDYMVLNEFEAERLTGITLGDGSDPDWNSMEKAAASILEMGVREWAVVHCPAGVVACGGDGRLLREGSVRIPEAETIGTVGAGDAFAAGLLYGVHESWDFEHCLKLGICVGASCLFDLTTSGSILPVPDCLELGEKYGFREV